MRPDVLISNKNLTSLVVGRNFIIFVDALALLFNTVHINADWRGMVADRHARAYHDESEGN